MPAHYDPLDKDFEAFVTKIRDEFRVPGMAIAVVHGDKTWTAGYGYADLETKEPVTPRTLFYAGSTTKSFMAAVVSKLIYSDDKAKYGDIKWETPLSELIREDFVLQDRYVTERATFADALCHRAGMSRHDFAWINYIKSTKDTIRSMRHLPLGNNQFRAKFEYNNLMYQAVMHAVETVTGKQMSELLHEWIWAPLEMKDSRFHLADALALVEKDDNINIARGYCLDETTDINVQVAWDQLPPATGAGGIISNVTDYTKWIRLFLHPESDTHNSTLSPKAVIEMTQAHMPIPPSSLGSPYTGPTCYGLGLQSGVYRGHQVIEHGGAITGYMANMTWIPDLDWGVVVFHNSFEIVQEPIRWRLIDDFLQTGEDERYDALAMVKASQNKWKDESENGQDRLFPDAPATAEIQPSVSLEGYVGQYHHPAYHTFILSSSPPTGAVAPAKTDSVSLRLYSHPSESTTGDLRFILQHINGEHWLAQLNVGAGKQVYGLKLRAKFESGADGKIQRMGLQIETALEDLIWFDKRT